MIFFLDSFRLFGRCFDGVSGCGGGGGSAWIVVSLDIYFPGDWDAEIHLEAIRRLKVIAVPCPCTDVMYHVILFTFC